VLELEDVCSSKLEGNRDSASNRFDRLVSRRLEATRGTRQHTGWTIELINEVNKNWIEARKECPLVLTVVI
jgi:hypothetical protein